MLSWSRWIRFGNTKLTTKLQFGVSFGCDAYTILSEYEVRRELRSRLLPCLVPHPVNPLQGCTSRQRAERVSKYYFVGTAPYREYCTSGSQLNAASLLIRCIIEHGYLQMAMIRVGVEISSNIQQVVDFGI